MKPLIYMVYAIGKNKGKKNIINNWIKKGEPLISSGIILFTDDATETQKEEIKNMRDQNAEITSTDVILENSKKYVEESLRIKLPLPMFMLIVSSLSYISIAILRIYKKKAN